MTGLRVLRTHIYGVFDGDEQVSGDCLTKEEAAGYLKEIKEARKKEDAHKKAKEGK